MIPSMEYFGRPPLDTKCLIRFTPSVEHIFRTTGPSLDQPLDIERTTDLELLPDRDREMLPSNTNRADTCLVVLLSHSQRRTSAASERHQVKILSITSKSGISLEAIHQLSEWFSSWPGTHVDR